MAMIKCTECGKEFSDRAVACPNCGCPTELVLEDIKKVNVENVKGSLVVEDVFSITGKGIVVEGTLKGGVLSVGQNVSWVQNGTVKKAKKKDLDEEWIKIEDKEEIKK